MNNVVKFGGGALTTGDLNARLNKFKQTAPTTGDGGLFIKMAKDGEWLFGANNELVQDADEWAANPHSLQQGYICWATGGGGAQPLGERMFAAGADIPGVAEMPRHEDGKWSDQLSIGLHGLTKPNKGLDVLFKTNSAGGVSAINKLVDAIMAQSEEDPVNIVPVVNLVHDHYTHKKYGKIYTPVLEIVRWMAMDGSEAEAVENEPAPIRRRRR